jgi:hypothetical protein
MRAPGDGMTITAHQLPQCDGNARPALAGDAVGGERNLVVFDARDVFHEAFAVGCPSIHAEGEVSSRGGHLRPLLAILPPLRASQRCIRVLHFEPMGEGPEPEFKSWDKLP